MFVNKIEISIYSSSVNFTNLYIDLEEENIILNQKRIKLSFDDLFVIVDKIIKITNKWDDIEMINLLEYQKVTVSIQIPPIQKEYMFLDNVPVNLSEIYSIILELEEKYE